MRFPVRTALRSEPGSFSRAKVCSASTAQSIALLGTAPIWVPAAIAAPVELTVILGQDAPTEDQSGNSRRIECATSHGPCASRCRAHMRVFARESAAVDPAATRGLRTTRDAEYVPDIQRVSACMSHYRRYLSPACRAVFQGGAKKKVRRLRR